MPNVTPWLWFDTEGEEAADFYHVGLPELITFDLDGQQISALNGGPQYKFNEAVSLMVECADQTEVDYYWKALSEGGEQGSCGWLKDRYGLSWQIVPRAARAPGRP